MFKPLSWQTTGWILALLTVAVSALFMLFPQLDIATSALFFDPLRGFDAAYPETFHIIRMTLYYGVVLVGLASLALFLRSLAIGARRRVPLRVWGFVVTTFLAGPLILTNSILKSFWGRARPLQIEAFGGSRHFSLPWVISDQCDLNCSFVSGEGSALAAVILVAAILVWPNARGLWRGVLAFVLLPLGVFGIALRVIVGAHFLSDSLLAVLLMALVTWAFYGLFDMRHYRHDLTWTNLRKDLSKQG